MTKPSAKAKDTVQVRPKASHRKGRTVKISHAARVPTQERSRKRYQAIIEATEKLLETANIEDISLYDIARQAHIAPPSVHYLFSTMAAIHVELNRLYNDRMTAKVLNRQRLIVGSRNPNWQSWTRSIMEEARDTLNASRPMSEIMLGPTLHRESRRTSVAMNYTFGSAALVMMQDVFVMPDIPDLAKYYAFSSGIAEALWGNAYAQCGRIDDETFEESVRATVAYLRCFLPETLRLKVIEPAIT